MKEQASESALGVYVIVLCLLAVRDHGVGCRYGILIDAATSTNSAISSAVLSKPQFTSHQLLRAKEIPFANIHLLSPSSFAFEKGIADTTSSASFRPARASRT